MNNETKRKRPASAKKNRPPRMEVRGYSRPPLARMLRIHELLMASRYPNCTKVSEEFEVSAKTVQRDVNFMRDRMGLPIEYDKERFGFHYTRPVSGFPGVTVSAGKGGSSPWRQSSPPMIGETPALAAAGSHGYEVRIRFDAESARMVRARTWHATQAIHSVPGGGVDITLRARNEWDIARWVLSWGAHAWVIEPVELRNRVREIAREILTRH